MKFFKKLHVSIGFSSTIFKNSPASVGGGSAPEPPTTAYVDILEIFGAILRKMR